VRAFDQHAQSYAVDFGYKSTTQKNIIKCKRGIKLGNKNISF